MPSSSTLVAFAAAPFLLVALPGPNMLCLLARSISRQAVMVQVLNPKVAVFFLAFVPQFVDPDQPAASQIVVLGLLLAAIGLGIGIPLALAAGRLAQRARLRRDGGRRPW